MDAKEQALADEIATWIETMADLPSIVPVPAIVKPLLKGYARSIRKGEFRQESVPLFEAKAMVAVAVATYPDGSTKNITLRDGQPEDPNDFRHADRIVLGDTVLKDRFA